MLMLAAAMAVLTCAVGFVGNVAVFAMGVAMIGLFLAPSIITGYLAAERLVPHHALTEASVWTTTALNLGAAIANTTAGAVIAHSGVPLAMLLAGILALAAAACAPQAALRDTKTECTST